MGEKNKCPVKLKPMEEWVKEGKAKECRPCLLGPVAQWYTEELKEKGHPEMAQKVEELADNTDIENPEQVLTFCQELDKIKETVEVPLRERLEEFDCEAQAFDPDAAIEE